MPEVRRVGHKGADHIAPGNTLASFDAALRCGVDMIEFDVLPENPDGTGELYLAHDYKHLTSESVTLEQGLAHIGADAFAGIELDVDLKTQGYEARVVAALQRHGLATRTLISTMEVPSLARVREADPQIRLGQSVPRATRDYLANPFTKVLALAYLQQLRRSVPREVCARLRAGEIDAVMSHWSLVTPRFADAIASAGGELFVWTVDDADRIATLEQIEGVSGIITNDPRLFA